MNRYKVLLVLLVIIFMEATAQAQETPQAPQTRPGRGGGAVNPATSADLLNLVGLLGAMQQTGQPPNTTGARGAGGRGARSGGPGTDAATNPGLNDLVNAADRLNTARSNPVNTTLSTGRGLLVNPASGAWWTNTALLTRLGLTEDQKLRIERVFESNRQNLTTSKDTLEKEETQLARLLDAEPLDRGGVTTQIYKVVQARGEMEKVNALMTLEMREVLTRAQWMQLQVQQSVNVSVGLGVTRGGLGTGQRSGARSGGLGPGTTTPTTTGGEGARGTRGQQ